MSVDSRELQAFVENLSCAEREMPEVMKELIVGEGVYAVGQAKKICKDEKIIKTGNFRNSFHTDPAPRYSGSKVTIDIHNNADYASHLEYGHIAVGNNGGSLRQRRRYALRRGHFVRGRYVLTRAIECTQTTQAGRINRKLNHILNRYFGGGT